MQLEQGQVQMQQMQEQAGQQMQQMQQQAGQEIQKLQGKLAQYSDREEMRKDAELQIRKGEAMAKVMKLKADTTAVDIENRVLGPELLASVEKIDAETTQIYHNISHPDGLHGEEVNANV